MYVMFNWINEFNKIHEKDTVVKTKVSFQPPLFLLMLFCGVLVRRSGPKLAKRVSFGPPIKLQL